MHNTAWKPRGLRPGPVLLAAHLRSAGGDHSATARLHHPGHFLGILLLIIVTISYTDMNIYIYMYVHYTYMNNFINIEICICTCWSRLLIGSCQGREGRLRHVSCSSQKLHVAERYIWTPRLEYCNPFKVHVCTIRLPSLMAVKLS